ncbi:Uncharacterised protein [Actinobacillus pleuropneumoniae]|nr:Uncharacterised protein [Actinobacillus pleuropneumoniae]
MFGSTPPTNLEFPKKSLASNESIQALLDCELVKAAHALHIQYVFMVYSGRGLINNFSGVSVFGAGCVGLIGIDVHVERKIVGYAGNDVLQHKAAFAA